MKTTLTITVKNKQERAKINLRFNTMADAGETLRRVLPLLLVRGRWEAEQITSPLGFEFANGKTHNISPRLDASKNNGLDKAKAA